MKRIMSMLVAIAIALVMSASLAAPANAASKHRSISIKASNKGSQAYLGGHVGPGNKFRKKIVIVQKKNCAAKKCKWRKYKQVRTSKKSNYRVKITMPRNGKKVVYRVKTKKRGAYKASYSKAMKVWWM